MKELWMRVGMTFKLSDEEADAILNPADGKAGMRAIVGKAFDEGRFELDGDTYVPVASVEDFNSKYGTEYDACEYECSL